MKALAETLDLWGLIPSSSKTRINDARIWEKCKKLGSFLDTKTDLKSRKVLPTVALNKPSPIWNFEVQTEEKIRIFQVYAVYVYVYGYSYEYIYY